MKKLITRFLIAILVLTCLSACGKVVDTSVTTVPGTSRPSFSMGSYDSRRYTNDWADLTIRIPDGYRVQPSTIDYSDDCAFYITNDSTGNLTLSFYKSNGYETSSAWIDGFFYKFIETRLSDGLNNHEYGTRRVGGYEYRTVDLDYYEDGAFFACERLYARAIDNYVVILLIAATSDSELASLESAIS